MLTEILLQVTNEEIETVAREVYYKAKTRAAKGTQTAICCHQIDRCQSSGVLLRDFTQSIYLTDCKVLNGTFIPNFGVVMQTVISFPLKLMMVKPVNIQNFSSDVNFTNLEVENEHLVIHIKDISMTFFLLMIVLLVC